MHTSSEAKYFSYIHTYIRTTHRLDVHLIHTYTHMHVYISSARSAPQSHPHLSTSALPQVYLMHTYIHTYMHTYIHTHTCIHQLGKKCTSVSSTPFDIFTPPSQPTNLRVYSYGPLGFRMEFEPGFISRLKPLSGFIVEVDVCDQSGTVSALCVCVC
jgi:hypothetical protein